MLNPEGRQPIAAAVDEADILIDTQVTAQVP